MPREIEISFIMMGSLKYFEQIVVCILYNKIDYFVEYFDNFAYKAHAAILHLNACHRTLYNNGFLT